MEAKVPRRGFLKAALAALAVPMTCLAKSRPRLPDIFDGKAHSVCWSGDRHSELLYIDGVLIPREQDPDAHEHLRWLACSSSSFTVLTISQRPTRWPHSVPTPDGYPC